MMSSENKPYSDMMKAIAIILVMKIFHKKWLSLVCERIFENIDKPMHWGARLTEFHVGKISCLLNMWWLSIHHNYYLKLWDSSVSDLLKHSPIFWFPVIRSMQLNLKIIHTDIQYKACSRSFSKLLALILKMPFKGIKNNHILYKAGWFIHSNSQCR